MKSQTVKAAFPASLPVLTGYLTMGFAAGVLLAKTVRIPLLPFWAFLTSALNISGALQFILVSWIQNRTPLANVALLTFCLNIRYALYGFSLLEDFRGIPLWKKFYLVWTLTDETYALEVAHKAGTREEKVSFCLTVAAFDHLYWAAGVTAGALSSSALPFDCRGINFAMTALFLVILADQCRERANRIPAVTGAAAALLSLCFFPAQKMLLPAVIIMLTALCLFRPRKQKTEGGAA